MNEVDVLSTMVLQLHENFDLLSNVVQGDISMLGSCFVVHVVDIHQFDRNVARRLLGVVDSIMKLCSILCILQQVSSERKHYNLRLEDSPVVALANEVKETIIGEQMLRSRFPHPLANELFFILGDLVRACLCLGDLGLDAVCCGRVK